MTTALMDLSKSFPIDYSVEWGYSSKEERDAKIEEMAAFVSSVYGRFPLLGVEGREQLCKAGMWFGVLGGSEKFPSASECDEFESVLKQRIISQLTSPTNWIRLSTDYYPEGALEDVCESVFLDKTDVGKFFPYKTLTRIDLNKKEKKLSLVMNFERPTL